MMRPEIVDHLRDTLIEKQDRNPQYSLRSFARDLNLSSGKLSEILRSKSKITLNTFEQISNNLSLDETLHETFKKNLIEFNQGKRTPEPLDIDKSNFIMTNQHLALLGLINLSIFQHCTKWISQALKKDEKVIVKLLEDLIKVKLVLFENNQYTTKQSGAKISPPINEQVKILLKNGLNRASLASEHFEEDNHWFTNMVIPAPKKEISVMSKKFWNTFKEINFEQEQNIESSDELYEIVVGIFPITSLNSQ